MNNYLNNINGDDRLAYEASPPEDASTPGLMELVREMLRYWYLILLVFLLVTGVGGFLVMKLMKAQYVASGIIEIKPALPLVFSDKETGEIVRSDQNLNDQIELISTDRVMLEAVDILEEQNVSLFDQEQEGNQILSRVSEWLDKFRSSLEPQFIITPADKLRQMIKKGVVKITAGRRSNLITVSMTDPDAGKAKHVVDAIINAYMLAEGDTLKLAAGSKIDALDEQKKIIMGNIEFLQDIKKQKIGDSGAPNKELETLLDKKVRLEKEISLLSRDILDIERKIMPLETVGDDPCSVPAMIEKQFEYVNHNPRISSLLSRIDKLKEEYLQMKNNLSEDHPDMKKISKAIAEYETRLTNLKQELNKEFNDKYRVNYIAKMQSDLDLYRKELKKLQDMKAAKEDDLEENAGDIDGIREVLVDLEETENDLKMNQDMLDTIERRIKMLEVEKGREDTIKSYPATVLPAQSKKQKLLLALPFGGLGLGFGLAFLLVRLNTKVRLPNDILYATNMPVIGTVSNLKRRHGGNGDDVIDYQIIRSNISLFNDGVVPSAFCVMSARLGEGKSTLSINMAGYFARHGKRVLLIDGDFRRPDIARKLDLEENPQGITELLLGRASLDETVISNHVEGLDVLLPGSERVELAVERLTEKPARELMEELTSRYDHIIVDTPPILTVPDALLWGQLAGAAILSSFAGRSTRDDITESVEKLKKAEVKLLGVVLANVSENYHYYKYRYDDHAGENRPRKARKDDSRLLITRDMTTPKKKTDERNADETSD